MAWKIVLLHPEAARPLIDTWTMKRGLPDTVDNWLPDTCYVASHDGIDVAALHLYVVSPDCRAFIDDLYTNPSVDDRALKKEACKRVFRACVERAKELGVRHVTGHGADWHIIQNMVDEFGDACSYLAKPQPRFSIDTEQTGYSS
jgi:hypothetical protein